MKKSDLLIEILSWIAIIMIIGFFVWINYEFKQESGDGMQIALLVAGYNCWLA